MIIARAQSGDWPTIVSLLQGAGLPTDDLQLTNVDEFYVGHNGDERVAGAIGLQSLGELGLLRSLVVHGSARGRGLGQELVARLESDASSLGLRELWLLTIDAQDFFARLGYAQCDRDSAPDAVRQTDEFSSLCPDTAYVMVKRLDKSR